ncbi:MAG: hypothetical protein DRJ42_18760 [Deltaproteobacteria bacterium]|nr:MAG: hypothetical protein DRJ42_18760 [Deltaproteobacteria bacterium]
MEAQQTIAASIARIFRAVFVVRRRRARALRRAARSLGLATRTEVADLGSRADLALGRARRDRDEGRDQSRDQNEGPS